MALIQLAHITLCERHGRQIDVEKTLCANWETYLHVELS